MSRALVLGFLLALSAAACDGEYLGETPDFTGIHYPISAAVDSAGDHLYIANSNYDLAYKSAFISVMDLDDGSFVPESGISMGSFPGAMLLSQPSWGVAESGYLAVREDNSLTWFNIDRSGTVPALACQDAEEPLADRRCSGRFVVTQGYDSTEEETRDLGSDPFSLQPINLGGLPGLLVTTVASGTVELFSLEADGQPIARDNAFVAQGLSGVVVHPSGAVFTCSRYSPRLYKLGLEADAEGYGHFQTLQSQALPVAVANGDYCRSLALTADGSRLLLLYRSPASLMVFDSSTAWTPGRDGFALPVLGATVPLGRYPSTLALFPSGEGGKELAYVLNYGEHSVLVVDPEAMTVVAKVEVAKAPFYMVHNPLRKEGYVLNFETDSISVLDLDPASATYHTVKGEWK
jgi:hypothetical protein